MFHPKIVEIVWKFIHENEKTYNDLCQFKEIFQYDYSVVYSEIYCTTERHGFDLKSTFQLVFKTYTDKKKLKYLGKEPSNFTK